MSNEFPFLHLQLKEFIGPKDADPNDIWWRAEDRTYAASDPWDEGNRGTVTYIELHPWLITKRTPKGVWAMETWEPERFILGKATKQICVPTQELALQDLVARKKVHVRMTEVRARNARYFLALATKALIEKTQKNKESNL